MASTRKKLDEKNLKTIRELGALPQNKYCFDCNQRGPTYVNVTIGSFVCTKCSGMLRGLTPPHRVKSISMATFTSDEVELLRSRGNAHCRRVWLGLHDHADTATPSGDDESVVRDFMVVKYERRRYYLDAAHAHAAGEARRESKPMKIDGGQVRLTQRSRPEINRSNLANRVNGNAFVANFERADIFGGAATTLNNGNNNVEAGQHNGFANFDDNPVFGGAGGAGTTTTALPTPASFNHSWNTLQNPTTPAAPPNATPNGTFSDTLNRTLNGATSNGVAAPAEDKYAALKDLDNEIKSQKNGHVDWGSTGSNGSLYSSPTPTGSVYSSPSPQGSIFGSPSQGQFMSTFPPTHEPHPSNVSNPFGSNAWGPPNGVVSQSQQHQAFANPFKESNGFSQVFQPIAAYPVNGTNGWTQNPFMVGGTNLNSNNPFL